MAANVPDEIDLICRLACFGSDDGTFHVLNRKYQAHQADFMTNVLKDRGHQVVKRLKTIATQKRYAKKENILFSLAATINAFGINGEEHSTDSLCQQAYKLAESLCESPADLFTFIHFDKEVRTTKVKASWGRGMRSLVTNFYSRKSPEILARQITQCKSGHGFTHRDLMRLIHLPCDSSSRGTSLVLNYALKGPKALDMEAEKGESSSEGLDKAMSILKSVERLRKTQDTDTEVIRSLVETHNLVDKQIPSHFFKLREVFEGLLGHMSLTSLVKSIPKMAELGLLDQRTPEADTVIERLKDTKAFEEERISPVTVFVAQRKYDMNRFKKWIRNPILSQTMKAAFETSLNNVPSTNKRYLLACHIDEKSISKTCVTGTSCMSPIMPCVILAQILAKKETDPQLVYYRQNVVTELSLSKGISSVGVLEQILKQSKDPANEDYDLCDALKWAAEKKKAYDCIVIVASKKRVTSQTDLKAAINHYRAESGVSDAKVAIVGLQGPISFPNRDDINFLDVTGFDDDVLSLLHAFCKGLPTEDMDQE